MESLTKQKFSTVALAFALVLRSYAAAQEGPGQKTNTRAQISPSSRRQILVSIPERKLAVVQDGIVLRTFFVAVGAAVSPSPTGEFEIITRVTNPTYYHPGVVIPAGNDSPIGTRWIGLNRKGYGIHGTNEPRSIGHASSHGCIRLRNRDMEQLFAMVEVGDSVDIRGVDDEFTAAIFGARKASPATLAQSQTVFSAAARGQ